MHHFSITSFSVEGSTCPDILCALPNHITNSPLRRCIFNSSVDQQYSHVMDGGLLTSRLVHTGFLEEKKTFLE